MMSLHDVKTALKKHNIRPNKKLGQNFLIDNNIRKKILDAVSMDHEGVILEIGPGLGALTEGLCSRAENVVAVEKDRRCYDFLSSNTCAQNLKIVNADIFDYLERIVPEGGKFKIAGNLPYYISSPIIIKLLEKRQFFSTIFVTVQKEFAERLVALPGRKEYGSISCFVQFYAEPRILFKIKRSCFYPAPKVDSCFMRLDVREKGLYLTDDIKLFKIIRASFGKRRKTILNTLYSSGIFESKRDLMCKLEAAGISPERRAETVSLDEFVRLAELTKKGG